MSTQVQYRRGTSTQNNAFTGALAEITVDTTNLTLRVHDGITAGGSSLVGLTASQTLTNKIYQGTSVSVTGNVTGGNVTTAGVVSATGNVSGGNIAGTTGAFVTVTGNANATSLTSGTVPSARLSGSYTIDISGAATTAATVTTAAQPNITSVGTLTSASITGNVTAGNVNAGNITIAGDLISSLGATLTIDPATVGNAGLVVINGNLQVNGTTTTINSNVVSTNDLTVNYANNAINSAAANGGGIEIGPIGSPFITWLYNDVSNVFTSSGGISAVGNISGGNLSGTSIVGTLTTAAQTNITSVGTLDALSVTGNITGGNLITAGLVSLSSITKTGSNGVGNIGAAASTFNTVFAKATSAQYADVAERYQADCEYAPGTVLIIGGSHEVTASTVSHDHRAAGVVSENPSYLMNSALDTVNSVAVALLGRVPCQVVGPIDRGDLLTTSTVPGTAGRLDPAKYLPGCVIGKALQDYHSEQPGTIEIAVGVK